MQTHEGIWGCCIRSAWRTAALRAWAGAARRAAAEAGPACAYSISVNPCQNMYHPSAFKLSVKQPARKSPPERPLPSQRWLSQQPFVMAQPRRKPSTVPRSGPPFGSCLPLPRQQQRQHAQLRRAHPVLGGQILRHSLVVVLAVPIRPAVHGGRAQAPRHSSHAPGPRARAPHSGRVPQREQRPSDDACAGAHNSFQQPQSFW